MSVNIVLLAGGEGLRLWPLSTIKRPKQFITLSLINLSSFQLALNRALSMTQTDKIIIVTSASYLELLIQQFEDINLNYNDFNIIFEKCSNNTGIAVYHSCCLLLQSRHDNLTYFFPTDQYISESDRFFSKITEEMNHSRINIFGQKVKNLCANFGYLVAGEILKDNYYHLDKFIEKPDPIQIKALTDYTALYRNLGIYLSKPSVLYQEFNKFYNDLPECKFDLNLRKHQVESRYANLPIDKMISEKSSMLNMYEINFSWQDIGSFEGLYKYCDELGFMDCSVDIENILKFNQENKEYSLEIIDDKVRIIKK